MTTTAAGAAVQVGERAPDFTLKDQHGQDVRLSAFAGRQDVALVFFPFAFSGVCTGELCEIRDNLAVFQDQDVQVLAVSVDHFFSQRTYADAEGFTFPLLSDYWPHGEVARAYGVFDDRRGFARRGTFLIDRDGVVRWSVVSGMGKPRDFAGYRAALQELRRA